MLWTHFISLLFFIKASSLQDINGENRTIIRPLQSNVTVTSGQKARLTCVFDRINHDLSILSSHQLIWIRQSHASYDADLILAHNQDSLISDDRLSIQRTDIDYSLVITNVNIADEGPYACEVNTQPPQKATISLYVQEIPTIIDNGTSSPLIVNEHDNITLECYARGRPQPYFSWFRLSGDKSEHIETGNQILAVHTVGRFPIINVNRYQSGHYECRASNGVSEHIVSKTIELRVLFPPSIRAESTLIYSTIGKTVELRCSAIVPFDTTIYWKRLDNSTLSKSATQQQQTHNDVTQTSLYLTELELRDFGFYACVAESRAGQNHASIELREHHRSSTSQLKETIEITTSRMQILKRNKVSEQTTLPIKVNCATSLFISLFDLFCMILVFNLT